MATKTSLDNIYNSLENIEMDIQHQIDDLEGQAPEHMNFRSLNEARKDLKEQVEHLRRWIDNFSIGDINQNTY